MSFKKNKYTVLKNAISPEIAEFVYKYFLNKREVARFLFDINKQPNQILINVAQKSEDFMVDPDDCTAEPCLLVRLAKRTLLLCLAAIAILILTGILN